MNDLAQAKKHRYVSEPGGQPLPSVTKILKRFDPDGEKAIRFAWAAVKIGRNFQKVWGASGTKGTRVHRAMLDLIQGFPTEVEPEDELLVSSVRLWLLEAEPELIDAEVIVVHPKVGYGGRFDLIVRIDGEIWLIDLKTGKRYLREVLLQVAAYRFARRAVYDGEGNFIGTKALPKITRVGALYADEKGRPAELVPLDVDPHWNIFDPDRVSDAFKAFCKIKDLYDWAERTAA